jgi:hypothetical protein
VTYPPRTRRQGTGSPAPGLGVITATVLTLGIWVWACGELAGWLASGRWPHVPASAIPRILARLPSHGRDPGQAWPASVHRRVPGPALWYPCALSLLSVAGQPDG